MQESDIAFSIKYLDEYEKEVFFNLKGSEQKHCVRVAKLAIQMINSDIEYREVKVDRIVKAALLHDVGKGNRKINVIEKSMMVILTKFWGDKLRKYENIEFVDSYYNHGEISYNMLKNNTKDDRLLFLIKNHHLIIEGDKELELLKYCDDRN
jgi:putative nucleotidyltransferase with HDIG domain